MLYVCYMYAIGYMSVNPLTRDPCLRMPYMLMYAICYMLYAYLSTMLNQRLINAN